MHEKSPLILILNHVVWKMKYLPEQMPTTAVLAYSRKDNIYKQSEIYESYLISSHVTRKPVFSALQPG